jgi:ABC-type antimicrobial peptide transport system permease subunit
MSLSSIFSLIFKKLSVKTGKALYLIIPIALLTSLSLIAFSQALNFQKATTDAVFGTIATQNTVLQITKAQNQDGGGFGGGGGRGGQDTVFSTDDIATVKGISNVTSATVNYNLPINSIKTNNLADKKIIDFGGLTVATPEIGSLYTTEKFEYVEGQPIPIILNAASMTEQFEDWGGKDSISVARPQRPAAGQPGQTSQQRQAQRDLLPFKTQALALTKEQLLNREFDINFGGLDQMITFTNTVDADNITYKKITEEEKTAKENARKDTISKYWDYTKVSTPLTYKFKVVGYIKSDSKRFMYIPEAFAEQLMAKLIDNQLAARNTTAIPVAELGTQFRGITYNGLTLNTTQGNANRGPQGAPGGQGQRPDSQASSTTPVVPVQVYTIPGLVIQTDPNTNTIQNTLNESDIFNKASKTSQILTVKFNSLDNKEQVIRDLNNKRFTYIDTSNSTVINNLQSTLTNILKFTPLAFGALIAAILGLNMAKTISEGKKEIGIMRALGFTKGNIVGLFGLQGIIYTLIGSVFGLILGLVGNFIIANLSYSRFQDLVSKTVSESFGVKPNIELSQFQNFDFKNASILGLVLLILTILISLFFSIRASNISPVEAIKAE